MNKPTPLQTTPASSSAVLSAQAQLQAWEALREQMQTLHAELEYLRLMLKINAGRK